MYKGLEFLLHWEKEGMDRMIPKDICVLGSGSVFFFMDGGRDTMISYDGFDPNLTTGMGSNKVDQVLVDSKYKLCKRIGVRMM